MRLGPTSPRPDAAAPVQNMVRVSHAARHLPSCPKREHGTGTGPNISSRTIRISSVAVGEYGRRHGNIRLPTPPSIRRAPARHRPAHPPARPHPNSPSLASAAWTTPADLDPSAGSSGSPTRKLADCASATRATKLIMDRAFLQTGRCFPRCRTWPELAKTRPSTAARHGPRSRSASANTMFGRLAPQALKKAA